MPHLKCYASSMRGSNETVIMEEALLYPQKNRIQTGSVQRNVGVLTPTEKRNLLPAA